MIHTSLNHFLPQIIEILKRHKIRSAYLFGSVVTEKFNTNSDIDLLVNIDKNLDPVDAGEHLWDIAEEIENLLNRKIDLLTESALKNPFFIKEINHTKIKIYG